MVKSPKIFIGNNDVASQISDLKLVFKDLGFETLTVTDRPNASIIRGNVDYNFTEHKKLWFGGVRPRILQKWLQEKQHIEYKVWRQALKECDVFIFIWSSFQPDYSDFIELKKRGKTLINCFVGDDARWYYAAKQEYEHHGMIAPEYEANYNYGTTGLLRRLRHVRMAERYCDAIFSRYDQGQLQLRPYYRWNMMVMSDQIPHNPTQRKVRPKILHAPSNRKAKGTEFVLDAFDKLKNEGLDFEVVLLENVPNEKAIEIYSDADVIIDQLIFPGTGKFSTEGLAAGKVVMSHMAYDNYPQKNPKDCPIIDVNPSTIYHELKSIISDLPKRQQLANIGRDYVNKYLDVKIFCQTILDLHDKKEVPFDYEPDFFREHFVPESEESKIEYNKWTEFVKNCDWYKELVPSGKRDGLFF
tara:strand:+ start:4907 stop:6148 length:1242 start_codon:yes stop_codon:yes gene_type:complete